MMDSAASRTSSATRLTLNCERRWSPRVTGEERKVSKEGFSTDSEAGLLWPGSRYSSNDEPKSIWSKGSVDGGPAAERAERQGPAHLRLRPGPVRPAGADHARVHADRGHPDSHVPAASAPLDRVVQPEHDAEHLPRRPGREDRLDHRVRDHVHRLGPAGRPHADRDPHALRPAHRDDVRRQTAELRSEEHTSEL